VSHEEGREGHDGNCNFAIKKLVVLSFAIDLSKAPVKVAVAASPISRVLERKECSVRGEFVVNGCAEFSTYLLCCVYNGFRQLLLSRFETTLFVTGFTEISRNFIASLL
jgi:hypothetical protein